MQSDAHLRTAIEGPVACACHVSRAREIGGRPRAAVLSGANMADPGYSLVPDPSRGRWPRGARFGLLSAPGCGIENSLVKLDSSGEPLASALRGLGLLAPAMRGEESEKKFWDRKGWGDPKQYREKQWWEGG